MAGEGGDDDLPVGLGEHAVEHGADLVLVADHAGDLGVGGVDAEQVDALVGEAGEGAQVRHAPVDGQGVHLEVAGGQDAAGRGAHEHGHGVGDGVVDGHELQVEGAVGHALVLVDDVEHRADAVLLELGVDEGEGEVGAHQGDVLAQAQQVGDAADVVLVPVGEDQGDDVVHAVLDGGEVGQDEVDAGLVLLGEQNAAVDDEELAVHLVDGHIAPDLAQSPERGDAHRTVGDGAGWLECGEVLHARSV